ncbi:MAG: hypothetical protein M3301_04245, partial [Chloroflexota bacterium]|nr:hypothetical protein [Chloroflexota bacterium]
GTTVVLANGAAFGPVDVPYGWGDLFDMGNKDDPWGSWNPKGNAWDTFGGVFSAHAADAGRTETFFRSLNSVVFAILPGSDDPVKIGDKTLSSQWSWAWAGDAQIFWKSPLSTTFKRIPAVVIPAAFPVNHPTPWAEDEFMTTLCHELGHNLGCPDLYGPFIAETAARDVATWDLMSTDAVLPHFALAHRMRLGWIDPSWVEAVDFGGNPSSRTVKLRAIEAVTRSGPPPGQRAGVEIRVRDGWNYYFEYRRGQGSQIGDQNLDVATAILGTDVHQSLADEFERPLIMKLADDVDGDGPVLSAKDRDYEESDVSSPERMHDFVITRGSTSIFDPDTVSVDITYLSAHRAELQISPAPGRGNFKSPDIDLAGPGGANRVVKGQKHTISARVRNAGTKDANDVRIRMSWLPFTTAPGSWTTLPDPPRQAIPAHSTRAFTMDWTPPASLQVDGKEVEHFCVRVDIDRYIDPSDPSGSEIVIFNNWAQSNFDTSAVGHGSPSDRRSTALIVTNKLPDRAIHRTVLDQSSPHFRAYVDRGWVRIDPGETTTTELSYESLAGDPIFGAEFRSAFEATRGEMMVNDLVARTMAVPKQPRDGDIERWGVQLRVRAGLRTRFERFEARGEAASGLIVGGDPGAERPVDGGDIRVVAWPADRPDDQEWMDGTVEGDGTFVVLLANWLVALSRAERVIVSGFYHGTTFFTPCRSEETDLR